MCCRDNFTGHKLTIGIYEVKEHAVRIRNLLVKTCMLMVKDQIRKTASRQTFSIKLLANNL